VSNNINVLTHLTLISSIPKNRRNHLHHGNVCVRPRHNISACECHICHPRMMASVGVFAVTYIQGDR
jgi:hypothetical protein